jgi:hypothetical protein
MASAADLDKKLDRVLTLLDGPDGVHAKVAASRQWQTSHEELDESRHQEHVDARKLWWRITMALLGAVLALAGLGKAGLDAIASGGSP